MDLPSTLNETQHQVLIGGLLGDFGLSKSPRSKNPRFKVDRQFLDKKYIEWQFNIFKDFCRSPVIEFEQFDKRYGELPTTKVVGFLIHRLN